MEINRIRDTYEGVKVAKIAYEAAAVAEIDHFEGLQLAVGAAIVAGEIVGKNEAERDAAARRKFPDAFATLTRLQRTSRKAKHFLDLVNLDLACLRMELRALELAAKVRQDDDDEDQNG